jgi:hypothetical protein
MNLYGQAQGLTVTAHRSEQDDIDGRSLIIVANPVTGGPLGNINASDIRYQIPIFQILSNNLSPADNFFPVIWQVSENIFFFDLQQKYFNYFLPNSIIGTVCSPCQFLSGRPTCSES